MDCLKKLGGMAEKLGGTAVGCLLEIGIREAGYVFSYVKKVDELNNSIKDLGLAKERVDHLRDEAEKNLKNIEGQVIEWFRKVDECETEVEEFRNDEGHRKTHVLNDLFPYLGNRYRLGKQAVEIVEEVKKLLDECSKFKEVGYRQNITSNDVTLSNAGYVKFDSRKSTIEKIMGKLEDSTVRMVGLHGPGGVGKSTLIKAIAKKAQDEKLFNVVVIADITANPNLLKIQEEIAYVLGLRLEGEGVNVRADCLRKRLRQEKDNTLIILDDLWDTLDLNKLGIPLDDDMDAPMKVARIPEKNIEKQDNKDNNSEVLKKEKSLGDYKGCKILLTSRDKVVLSEKMGIKSESIFSIKELDDMEALALLRKVVGITDELSQSKKEIVKKYCAGIPMAILTVGRALRDKSESVWEATLEKLKRQELVGAQNSMEISVKMSYDHLENEELKSVFLLCAQMGHQPLVMDLVKYSFGLGILKGVYSLKEARDRIYTSIQKLKHSGLVTLDESSDIRFGMHDMVRDAALSIAHKEKNAFTLRNAKLEDWHELKRCTSISICNCDIIDKLPDVINFPELKFLQINSDDPSLKIPRSFFNKMKKLRVLILTGVHLKSLSPRIKCLSDLRLLCLERCILDGNLSFTGELEKLRILSFSGSQLKSLPAELGCLDKLQLLDINNCSMVDMIPVNLLSRLTSLEELYIGNSLTKALTKREAHQSQFSFLHELKHLNQLKVVDLCIPCAAVLPKDLFFHKLNDFKIVIGDFKTSLVGDFVMPNKHEVFISLALELKDGADNIHSQKGMKLLFKRVENLLLGELNGVEKVIDELNLDGFPNLKHLSIANNNRIKYINSMDLSHSRDVFPNLESLSLSKLTSLQMICHSPVTIDSFAKLKIIKVIGCNRLKNLFSFYKVKFVACLETIDVSNCNDLQEIVETLVNFDKVEFLKLKSLTLQSLPSFTRFHKRVEGSSVSQLFGELVEIPNLESLSLSSVRIHKIWSDQPLSSFCFQNLVKLVVKDCDNLKYLCSLSVANALKKLKGLFISLPFPKLEEIHISQMETLTDIWHAEASVDSFSSLISVHIDHCTKLDKIFPGHMEGWFASLNSLKVSDCESVNVIFEIKDSHKVNASGGIDTKLQLIDVCSLPNLRRVWSRDPGGILNFTKLCSVEIFDCGKLENVFPVSVAKDIQKLEYMSVSLCNNMVEIVACKDGSGTNNQSLVFPELTYLQLYSLPCMKHFYTGRHTIHCTKLKQLAVAHCGELKIFPTETSQIINEESPIFSTEVIPNLERLYIDFEEAQEWLLINTEKYQMHRLKELALTLVNFNRADHLFKILYRLPNLEKLNFSECDLEELVSSENVVAHERLGSVLQLKELVVWQTNIKDLGFEREPDLQRLELLDLYSCDQLRNLAPPSVSLAYLTNLEVEYCNGLRNLMASSTAKSLVQLKFMKISRCNKLEEIVTNEENEEDEKVTMEIVFSKLITIELVSMKNLNSFCSHESCEFRFPSLEILIVRDCPKMKTFTKSPIAAPKLQNIFEHEEGEEEAKWQWEGDLNATIQKHFKDKNLEYASGVSTFQLGQDDRLLDFWLDLPSIPDFCFSNLQALIVEGCQFLSDAVLPFNLLPLFTTLEILEVRNCDSIKTIFDVKCLTQDIETTTMRAIHNPLPCYLKELTLEGLPNLENILNGTPKETNLELTLPHVKSLNLRDLPKLKYDMFKTSTHLEPHTENAVSIEKLPNIKKLALGENEQKMILDGKFQENHLHELKVLTLCIDTANNNSFLRWASNIERLGVFKDDFKATWYPSKLEALDLKSLGELVSTRLVNIDSFLRNLDTVEINWPLKLESLVPCMVSFSNLTYLTLIHCYSLLYLFTCSTAKTLAQLREMNIHDCDSIEEIVSNEGDESPENEIIYPQLSILKLSMLPKLKSFYKGSLSFPSLEKLSIIGCDKMKTFCDGTIKTSMLDEVSVDYHSESITSETDVNYIMKNRPW